MLKYTLLFTIFTIIATANAQSPGDTIIVSSLNYSSSTRDTIVNFPNNTALSFEKVLMYYNIRCKDGNVSPPVSGQTNIGCGEWDYSCNTYIHDSTRVDSLPASHPDYSISSFSGTSFPYRGTAMNSYYQFIQQNVIINNIIADTQSTVGSGTLSNSELISVNSINAKRQFLYTQAELTAAGAVGGYLDGIILNADNGTAYTGFLRIRIKESTKSFLTDSMPDHNGFTEVFFKNTNFALGQNRLQFYTPFNWNGTSNIIVELSYANSTPSNSISFAGSQTSQDMALLSSDDNSFLFNGTNYIETVNYKGIPGNTSRTVEAWIKTTTSDKEIVSWGENNGGEKWVFRLNGDGTLRVEVNGGYRYGSTVLTDGDWHHVACVFSGTAVNNIQLYVDGNLETGLTTANKTINTDTTNGIGLRISRGINNRYFVGDIDEVRIWDTNLSQATLQKWMYASLNSSHINYSNLQAYYPLNENTGAQISDYSGNNRSATAIISHAWSSKKGIDLFKAYSTSLQRPNTTFLQGTYQLTIQADTVYDTIPLPAHSVKQYMVQTNIGTVYSDDIVTIMDTLFWEAGNEYVYDGITGSIIDTNTQAADGTITISNMSYSKRWPMKFEIMSFVTPYGINLDMGMEGKTWTFDVTDFMPFLKGDKRLTVERGGQWQEDMDIKFAFIVGTPIREVIDIQQIWPVQYKSYSLIMNESVFPPIDVPLKSAGKSFLVRSSITGHGQQGEFTPRNHYINIDGGSKEFTWQVWKTCAKNPVYPQGGTWIYDRAGWCPGAPTLLKEMDISSFVTAGQNANIDYGVNSASGTSNYIVNNQLVTYGDPNFSLDVAAIDITGPTDKVEYARTNSICNNPGVIIKNTGTTTLTSVEITYWVNNASTPNTFTWNGSLDFLEKTEVLLPTDSALWSNINPGKNKFHIKLNNPNGGTDEYSFNNTYTSSFVIPDVIPSHFLILLRTNLAANETSYKLYNEAGTMIFHKTGLSANTFYRDTFQLGVGCYKLEVLDSGHDGLKFFANNDGNGFINIKKVGGGIVEQFNPDFGSSIIYNFTIDFPLTFEEIHKNDKSYIYPNPSDGNFHIDFEGQQAQSVTVSDMMGRMILNEKIETSNNETFKLDLNSQAPGVYVVILHYDNRKVQHKVVVF
ncbi:MAG: T9SS type A sorting domain-containing protein [Bacteroidales bacterium]|nr:T9SS type A sorting domain-containing protein [Bacteroidales bacterium]